VLLVALSVAAPVAAGPARIVSTSPSITESLFALGLGDRVVAVSSFCRYPAEVTRLPTIGTFLRPDAELIARLRPDLVVVQRGPHLVEQQLAALGIPTATVTSGTLQSVYATIRTIGAAAGVPARADALVADLTRRLDRVHAAVADQRPARVLIIVGRTPGTVSDLVAVSRGSYLSDLVSIAGGVNVLSGDSLPDYPRISMESVIRLAPDVIVDTGNMGDTPDARQRVQADTEALWRRERNIPAVASGGVHVVVSEAFVVPGPRVVEVAEALAGWLHPHTR
jgi:iron complex transport system substrate-binding protein